LKRFYRGPWVRRLYGLLVDPKSNDFTSLPK